MEVPGHGDAIDGIKAAIPDEQAFARTEVDFAALDMFEPGVRMTIGEEEEEPFHLHAATGFEQLLHAAWVEIGEAFHQHVDLVKALMVGQFIEQFEHRPLRAGQPERPAQPAGRPM